MDRNEVHGFGGNGSSPSDWDLHAGSLTRLEVPMNLPVTRDSGIAEGSPSLTASDSPELVQKSACGNGLCTHMEKLSPASWWLCLMAVMGFDGWGHSEAIFRAYFAKACFPIMQTITTLRVVVVPMAALRGSLGPVHVFVRMMLPGLFVMVPYVLQIISLQSYCTFFAFFRVVGRGVITLLGPKYTPAKLLAFKGQFNCVLFVLEVLHVSSELCMPVVPWGLLHLLILFPVEAYHGQLGGGHFSSAFLLCLMNLSLKCAFELFNRRAFSKIAQRLDSECSSAQVQARPGVLSHAACSSELLAGAEHSGCEGCDERQPSEQSEDPAMTSGGSGGSSIYVDCELETCPCYEPGGLPDSQELDAYMMVGCPGCEVGCPGCEAESELFDGLQDWITYDEEAEECRHSPKCSVDKSELLRQLRLRKDLPLTYPPYSPEDLTTLHVYLPGADPSQMGPNTLSNFERQLSQAIPHARLLTSLARKGSLIITAEVLLMGSSGVLLNELASAIAPEHWLEWLDLPVRSDQEVLLQLGAKVVSMRWHNGAFVASHIPRDSSLVERSPIKSVANQIRLLEPCIHGAPPEGSCQSACGALPEGSCIHGAPPEGSCQSACGMLDIDLLVSDSLVHVFSEVTVRARCMDVALPVKVSRMSPHDLKHTFVKATLELPADMSAPAAEALQLNYVRTITLEVWKDRMMLQSVPVLLLPIGHHLMAHEWRRATDSLHEAMLHPCDPLAARPEHCASFDELSSTLSRVSSWLSFTDTVKTRERSRCQQPCDPCLSSRMAYLGVHLLEAVIKLGWTNTADVIVDGLCMTLKYEWAELMLGLNDAGMTLLHVAMLSDKSSMVAAVVRWGQRWGCGWQWNVVDALGSTPLHYLASCGNPMMAAAVLRNLPSAQKAWFKVQGSTGCTPHQLAVQAGLRFHLTARTRPKGPVQQPSHGRSRMEAPASRASPSLWPRHRSCSRFQGSTGVGLQWDVSPPDSTHLTHVVREMQGSRPCSLESHAQSCERSAATRLSLTSSEGEESEYSQEDAKRRSAVHSAVHTSLSDADELKTVKQGAHAPEQTRHSSPSGSEAEAREGILALAVKEPILILGDVRNTLHPGRLNVFAKMRLRLKKLGASCNRLFKDKMS